MHVSRRWPQLPFVIPNLYAVEYQAASYSDASPTRLCISMPPELDRAVVKRKASFLAGRCCARGALTEAGFDHGAGVAIGANRCPVWPPGVVGSITHTGRFAAATVARTADMAGIGLDMEPLMDGDTCRRLNQYVTVPIERLSLASNLAAPQTLFLSFVFSAKESIFKCLFPLVNRYFDFSDVAIVALDPERGRFRFRVLRHLGPRAPEGLEAPGHVALVSGGVLTYVALANPGIS